MMRTRSATRKLELKDDTDTTNVSPQDVSVQYSSDEDFPPPKKRPRRRQPPREAGSPSKRRRRGKAEELCQLNLDILFLIAEYIHPIDLLNLARTCKSLRALLMDRSSEFVWRKARVQTKGLPECPPDLTEPEYANLVFYARCHGCGKYAQIIFWRMRRRYCPACRVTRFCSVSCCDQLFRQGDILPFETFALGNDRYSQYWVDREQMETFLQEYGKSSDKETFLREVRERCLIIQMHAHKCESWKRERAYDRKIDLEARREARERSIFERLEQSGYGAEICHYHHAGIRHHYTSAFRTSKPLTDKEWDRMHPEWSKIMSKLRESRLEETVYMERRRVLAREYYRYVQHSPHESLSCFVPHIAYLANLPPFRDMIRAPEGIPIEGNQFASVLAQSQTIVEEWKEKVTAELAALVKIPSSLLPQDAADVGWAEASNDESAPHAPSPLSADSKLQLACALFHVRDPYASELGVHAYPDVLSACNPGEYPRNYSTESGCNQSVVEEFRIALFEEAAYIVHACGLDPSTATVEDMDHRNARLMCLLCKNSCVMPWRTAISHIRTQYPHRYRPPSETATHWQLVNDEYIDAIQAVERQLEKSVPLNTDARCLLCQRHFGDSRPRYKIMEHLVQVHEVNRDDIKEGEHFVALGIHYLYGATFPGIKMVVDDGGPTFKPLE